MVFIFLISSGTIRKFKRARLKSLLNDYNMTFILQSCKARYQRHFCNTMPITALFNYKTCRVKRFTQLSETGSINNTIEVEQPYLKMKRDVFLRERDSERAAH